MNIDILATITNNDGVYDDEGNVITNPTVIEGYHVNTTAKLIGLDAYLVEPSTPRQLFSGLTTHCYAFPDEAFWLALGTDVEDSGWALNAEYIPDPLAVVPQSVSRFQALSALEIMGYKTAVDAYIDQMDNLTQIAYQAADTWQRTDDRVATMAAALGLSGEQVDALFIVAGGVK